MAHEQPILVVDDDADIRDAISVALGDEGYEVAEASDGQEALSWLRSHPAPRAILLDWNMAPMNGPDFMAEVAKSPAFVKIPVIVVTADVRAPKALAEGRYTRWLTKPFRLDALFDLLRGSGAPGAPGGP